MCCAVCLHPHLHVLPQNVFYPFSWEERDYKQLVDDTAFDWSGTYAMHLYHSSKPAQSRLPSFGAKTLLSTHVLCVDLCLSGVMCACVAAGNGNLARAVRLAMGTDGVSAQWCVSLHCITSTCVAGIALLERMWPIGPKIGQSDLYPKIQAHLKLQQVASFVT